MTNSSRKQTAETRKLQITGGSTYIISLPKKWVVQNQLKKNSAILVRTEDDGSLSILPSGVVEQKEQQEAFLHVSSKDASDALVRMTVSAYLVGYNLIHIKAAESQQLSSRQRMRLKSYARDMLVGTEIVTDTPKELTLQVLLSYPELSVQSALRRMCIITNSMHGDAITALQKIDHVMAKDVIKTDSEVDRFNLYIVRQLKMAIMNPQVIKEIGLQNPRDCLGYRLVTKSVERTADHAVKIAENTLLLKKRLDESMMDRIAEMSELALSMFENSIESLYRRDFGLAESSIEKTEDILRMEKQAVHAVQDLETDEAANVRLIIESVRRTAEYAADIAEVVLNLTVDSVIGKSLRKG